MPRGRFAEPVSVRMSRLTVVDDQTGCHLWTGNKNQKGYGRIKLPGRRLSAVHRVAYELARGSIPAGYQIDHLCRNPACVNPAHLEAVTPQENNRRSNSPSAVNARATHCKRGHEFTPDTTGIGSRGQRLCLVCCPAKPRRVARSKSPPRPRDFRGERNSQAKLTDELVAQIRACRMPWTAVPGGFGISKAHFYKVKNGVGWPHINSNGGAS